MEKRETHKKMIHSADAMHRFAVDFAHDVSGGMVMCLRGVLGAGKTTFALGLLGALGAEGPFVSPTFLVLRQYDLGKDAAGFLQGIERIYHIDAYRITSQDMLELGWEEACLSPQENKRNVRTASLQQVRKNIYKGSSGAWRKFKPYLNNAFDKLV